MTKYRVIWKKTQNFQQLYAQQFNVSFRTKTFRLNHVLCCSQSFSYFLPYLVIFSSLNYNLSRIFHSKQSCSYLCRLLFTANTSIYVVAIWHFHCKTWLLWQFTSSNRLDKLTLFLKIYYRQTNAIDSWKFSFQDLLFINKKIKKMLMWSLNWYWKLNHPTTLYKIIHKYLVICVRCSVFSNDGLSVVLVTQWFFFPHVKNKLMGQQQ